MIIPIRAPTIRTLFPFLRKMRMMPLIIAINPVVIPKTTRKIPNHENGAITGARNSKSGVAKAVKQLSPAIKSDTTNNITTAFWLLPSRGEWLISLKTDRLKVGSCREKCME